MLLNYPLEKGVSKQLLRLPAPLSLPGGLVSNAKQTPIETFPL